MGLTITPAVLQSLQTGLNGAFKQGFGGVPEQWRQFAMEVPSTALMETYGWMKELPGMREWIGQRQVNGLESQGATLTNRDWEHTLGIKRTAIEDDRLGMYTLAVQQQGEVVARHPNELVLSLLPGGFTSRGLDGQYFFDADHIGYTAAGAETSYSNVQAGAGSPWVLMDMSRSYMKPLVFQSRKKPEFVAKTRSDDDHVFMENEYIYGADARYVAGYGFHHLAFGSKADLTAANFKAGRLAMQTQRRPDGSPLPVAPTHLVVGPSRQSEAEDLLMRQVIEGSNNTLYKAVELVVVQALG